MKKVTMFLMTMAFAISAHAQYNVGTSSRDTDSWGNSTSTHRNQYGQTTGTSSSYTDSWGLPVKVYLQNGKFERILVNIQSHL